MASAADAYLKRLAMFVMLLASPFVLHGVVVDPYGIWGKPVVGQNEQNDSDRVIKGIHLFRGDNDVILVGNSRILQGHNTNDPVFGALKVYNAAVLGGRYFELSRSMLIASEHQPRLKRVIAGLDISSFLELDHAGDYSFSVFSGESIVTSYLWATFSRSAINKSLRHWKILNKHKFDAGGLEGLFREKGSGSDGYRMHFIQNAKRSGIPCGDTRDSIAQLTQRMAEFETSLRVMRQKGIGVDLFLPPRHALMLAFDELAGKAPLHDFFKTLAVETVERVLKTDGSGAVRLWDFNDAHQTVAFDPVPQKGSFEPAKYYYEASHYNLTVGSAIHSVVLGKSRTIEGFGTRLTHENLSDQIVAGRERVKAWLGTFPSELDLIRDEAEEKRQCSLRATAQKMVRN